MDGKPYIIDDDIPALEFEYPISAEIEPEIGPTKSDLMSDIRYRLLNEDIFEDPECRRRNMDELRDDAARCRRWHTRELSSMRSYAEDNGNLLAHMRGSLALSMIKSGYKRTKAAKLRQEACEAKSEAVMLQEYAAECHASILRCLEELSSDIEAIGEAAERQDLEAFQALCDRALYLALEIDAREIHVTELESRSYNLNKECAELTRRSALS